jgi:hypothetical protein
MRCGGRIRHDRGGRGLVLASASAMAHESIPLGFFAVIIGSLLCRDRRTLNRRAAG